MIRSLTPEQAQLLCDALNIEPALDTESEEYELLEENNPALLEAFIELRAIADGSD